MHPAYYVLLFQASLIASIMSIALLSMYVFPQKDLPLPVKILFASTSWCMFALYYVISSLVSCVLSAQCRRRKSQHPHPLVPTALASLATPRPGSHHDPALDDPSDPVYNDLSADHTLPIVHGRPRLYMKDVWILVYGVGFSYYVLNYVATCRDLLSVQSFVWGLLANVGFEFVSTQYPPSFNAEKFMYLLAALIAGLGCIVRGSNEGYAHFANPFRHHDWFTVFFGIFDPLVASVMFISIKANSKYVFEGIYELCEFGFPFAIITAMCTLFGFSNFEFSDYMSSIHNEPRILVLFLVTPIFLLTTIILVMQAVIKSHILDVIIALTMSSGTIELMQNSANQTALASVIMSMLALFIRLASLSPLVQPQPGGTGSKNVELKSYADEDDVDSAQTRRPRATHTITDSEDDEQAVV